jgi:hypothetical protein
VNLFVAYKWLSDGFVGVRFGVGVPLVFLCVVLLRLLVLRMDSARWVHSDLQLLCLGWWGEVF